jgi:hypothetical protein
MGIQTSGRIRGTNLIVPAKLTVVTGSTLPTSKVQQRDEAVTLYRENAIDRQELLSSLEWSGRAEVIKRMNAGPIGAAMENIAAIGAPQQVVQFLSQIGTMDPKELQKAIKEGQIPSFQQLMQQLLQAQSGAPAPADPLAEVEVMLKQAEVMVKQASTEKTKAETAHIAKEIELLSAKIGTETVDQQVKIKGVEFDGIKLKMDQAKTVAEITKAAREVKTADLGRPKVTGTTPGSPSTRAPEPPIVQEPAAKPAGFNESGMVSDNKVA